MIPECLLDRDGCAATIDPDAALAAVPDPLHGEARPDGRAGRRASPDRRRDRLEPIA